MTDVRPNRADPIVRHVDPELDADHPVRVVPGLRGRGGTQRAACADCGKVVRAMWLGDDARSFRLEIEA